MGSLNSSGVPVVPKQNVGFRRYGRYTVVGSGTNPHGANNYELPTIKESEPQFLPGYTKGMISGIYSQDFYSTVNMFPPVKIYDSVTDSGILRNGSGIAPASGAQPEIGLKPVSQNFSFHTGARIVTANSDQDAVLSRAPSSGFRPS